MRKIVFISIVIVVFLLGIWIGANRVFPYDQVRSLSDKIHRFEGNITAEDKVGVVIFGDSLSARGDWKVIKESGEFELLILAKGGLRASTFPYDSNEYEGSIHAYWLGTNDLKSGLDYVNAYDALLALINRSQAQGKKIVILGIPYPLEMSDLAMSVFRSYNRRLSELCQKEGWAFIDTEKLLNEAYDDRTKITNDGVHLNLEASRLIAAEFHKVCERLK